RTGSEAEGAAADLSRLLHRVGRRRLAEDGARRVRARSPPRRRERSMRRAALTVTLAACVIGRVTSGAADRFDTRTASFAVTFHGESSAYRDAALVVLPGAAVVLDAVGGPPGDFAASTDHGTLIQQGARQWKWTAPQRPGAYLVMVDGPGKKDSIA